MGGGGRPERRNPAPSAAISSRSDGARIAAFVSLGSNLGDRASLLAGSALAALAATHGIEVVAVSGFYETDPVGPPPQGPYLNAAARIRTSLSPRALLERLLAIENEAGRVGKKERNAARSLDLDLLLYGTLRVDEPGSASRTLACTSARSCSSRSPRSRAIIRTPRSSSPSRSSLRGCAIRRPYGD